MRVIAGTARGRRLKAPPGRATRPTADRVKEAMFNVLAPRVPGARVLDLYAGTGALGIEAVSRGAERAVCVENAPAAWEALVANIAALGFRGRIEPVRRDVRAALAALAAAGEPFDLVLMDPPYRRGLVGSVLPLLLRGALLADDGVVVAEHGRDEPVPDEVRAGGGRLRLFRRLRYGDTALSFYRQEPPTTAHEGD